ncbi:His/Gly/Thr/Pro-type tRNA ligase C-terminal domain-containing protein [Salisaeta longa]|uniref:His/Gly/Thr/Pro-type tRNA ligase C-terminal domain-containing protein n=1 Tax=Salisaeta longa TaxID=503170 RepID=UPI0003B3EDC2|nr:His/Gly/Thr/Pro-type tRNA ligase C-terminal domain-containing protein [Salisaeta longa]
MDEAGTPFCVIANFDTLDSRQDTVRDRDSMEQARAIIDQRIAYINDRSIGWSREDV